MGIMPVMRCNMVALIDVVYVSIQLSEERINLHLNGQRSTNEIDLLLASDSACTTFTALFIPKHDSSVAHFDFDIERKLNFSTKWNKKKEHWNIQCVKVSTMLHEMSVLVSIGAVLAHSWTYAFE